MIRGDVWHSRACLEHPRSNHHRKVCTLLGDYFISCTVQHHSSVLFIRHLARLALLRTVSLHPSLPVLPTACLAEMSTRPPAAGPEASISRAEATKLSDSLASKARLYTPLPADTDFSSTEDETFQHQVYRVIPSGALS